MKYISLVFLQFIAAVSFCQHLLVNGSFEEENICTEYRVDCAPEGWISTSDGFSNYLKNPALAFDGEHCMAIKAGHTNKLFDRTYIRSQLLCRLRKGNEYQIDLFIKSRHSILDSFGIYFTSMDFLYHPPPLNKIAPNIYAADNEMDLSQSDTGWQQLRFNFVANGTEAFITLGNFSRRNITGSTGIDRENNFYILIDKISLIPKNINEKKCNDWEQIKKEIYDINERHHYLRRKIKQHDPNTPPPQLTSTLLPVMETIVIPDMLFATGVSNLSPAGNYFLDSICNFNDLSMIDSIVIEGHTDAVGDPAFNQQLSVERAVSVKNYILLKTGLNNQKIITRGFGSHRPVADNQTNEGRSSNRRVEIIIYKNE
jgi:outer membrane protein OmpA-like peptidoglycan-associated protein